MSRRLRDLLLTPTGCGKSAVLHEFQSQGYFTLDEGFLNMPEVVLHPQSLTMETAWMSVWFQRLLLIDKQLKSDGMDTSKIILVADRSPVSAVLYSKKGHLLKGE